MTGRVWNELELDAGGDAAFATECRSAIDVDCTLVTLSPLNSTPEAAALGPVDYVVFGIAIGVVVCFALMASFLETWLVLVRKLDRAELEHLDALPAASGPETLP